MNRYFPRLFLLLVVFSCLSVNAFGASDRFRFSGSSNIVLPTGYVQSRTEYISDGSHTLVGFSQKIPGNIFEVSALRHMNGATKNKNVYNVKMKILEEDTLIPSVAWGVSDFQKELGSKIFFVAASKSFETFGVTLHGGAFKDPVTTRRKEFWGAEKMIFPLVYVSGEVFDGQNTLGLKLRPNPGFNLEYAQQGVGKESQQQIFKFVYFTPF